jgi:DNA polymerase, archaea type
MNLFYTDRTPKYNPLIFGKDQTENVVSLEVGEDGLHVFTEKDGVVTEEVRPNTFWTVLPHKTDIRCKPLKGNLHYNYMKTYKNYLAWMAGRKELGAWSVWEQKEAAMIYQGVTYFKGMELEDLSVLSFDIESAGLLTFKHKEVYVISCTLWKNRTLTRKQFSQDVLGGEKQLIEAFCEWVREVDPSVMTGWNIYGYDFPYLQKCANKYKIDLNIGRDGSPAKFDNRESSFRYDGSNEWAYHDVKVYGREIVDGMFLAVKYDVGRNFPSWKLKAIMEHLHEDCNVKVKKGKKLNEVEQRIYEGMKDRQFYDAGTIKDNWHDPVEREKIKRYCNGDGDDALNFFHLAVPAYFYLNQSVPKPFTNMINKASGSQINSMLVRSYLQEGHSIPQGSPKVEFQGAISFGVPGVYKNVQKWDLAGLYPSIIRQYKIEDKAKDPLGNMLKIVDYVSEKRLFHKKVANETGSKYDRDMEQALKVIANSIYGFLGAQGLLFNSPECASEITRLARETLTQAIEWATSKSVDYWLDIVKEGK